VNRYIIITGNPVDGFTYTGPFESHGDAVVAAEEVFYLDDDYWIADLEERL
jgi:hypothetical protein